MSYVRSSLFYLGVIVLALGLLAPPSASAQARKWSRLRCAGFSTRKIQDCYGLRWRKKARKRCLKRYCVKYRLHCDYGHKISDYCN